jgi:hypothetical protein
MEFKPRIANKDTVPVKMLPDMNGPLASVNGARMAIEDFGVSITH